MYTSKEQLKTGEEVLHFIDNIPLCIIEDHRIRSINRKFEEFTGYAKSEIEEKDAWQKFVNSEYHPLFQAVASPAGEDKTFPVKFECEITTASGKGRLVECIITSYTLYLKPAICILFIDITGITDKRISLRRENKLYATLIENAADFITVLNVDGTIRYESPSVVRQLGYTYDELIGKNVFDFIHPEDKPNTYKTFLKGIVIPNYSTSLEVRFRHKDGSWRILEVFGKNLLFNPIVSGVVVNSRDITKRKRAEEELRASEVKFRTLFENVLDGVYQSTPDGKIITANPALIRMLGYKSVDELRALKIGTDLYVNPETRKSYTTILLKKGELRNAELELKRKDGTHITVLENAYVVRDNTGEIEYYEGTLTDITERKRIEMERAQILAREQAARQEAEEGKKRLGFLKKASDILAQSLDYPTTLTSVVNLAVPIIADWSAIDLIENDNTIKRLAVAHKDPEKVQLAHLLYKRFPPKSDSKHGVMNVLRTGKSEIYPEIPHMVIQQITQSEEHLNIINELGLKSAMIVPIMTHNKTLGAMTFVTAESGRRYSQTDLSTVEELAHYAGLAIDHSRLYHRTRLLNEELEQRVEERTAALRESEARYRGLVETAPDAIFTIDLDGTITSINPAFERITGWAISDWIGKSFVSLISPKDLRTAHKIFKEIQNHRNTPVFEIQVLTKENTYLTGEFTATPQIRDGEVVGILGIARNITERKQFERELHRSREQLRSLSTHLQFIREEERTRIAREIHDEFGQVLTAFKMDLSLLERKLINEDINKDQLLENVLNLTDFVDKMLHSVHRIVSELRPEVLDDLGLFDAIEWQANEFEKRSEIPCDIEINIDNLSLNKERATAVFRIFQETLTNVARHANATSVTITVEEQDAHLILKVQDNGRGITQSEINGSRSFGIMGMRERALLFGGEINISGSQKKGTTVEIRIPTRNHNLEHTNI